MNELILEKQLANESYYLRNIDWLSKKISNTKLKELRKIQNEKWHKYIFLKNYRLAKEKINEKTN